MIEKFIDELVRVGMRSKNWVILDGRDSFYGQNDFKRVFGDRYIKVDLKGTAVNQAAGFALTGKIPIVLGAADMFLKALSEIKDNLSDSCLNVKLVGIGDSDILVHMKNISYMNIIEPKNEEEAKTTVLSMIEGYGPIYVGLSSNM